MRIIQQFGAFCTLSKDAARVKTSGLLVSWLRVASLADSVRAAIRRAAAGFPYLADASGILESVSPDSNCNRTSQRYVGR